MQKNYEHNGKTTVTLLRTSKRKITVKNHNRILLNTHMLGSKSHCKKTKGQAVINSKFLVNHDQLKKMQKKIYTCFKTKLLNINFIYA